MHIKWLKDSGTVTKIKSYYSKDRAHIIQHFNAAGKYIIHMHREKTDLNLCLQEV